MIEWASFSEWLSEMNISLLQFLFMFGSGSERIFRFFELPQLMTSFRSELLQSVDGCGFEFSRARID